MVTLDIEQRTTRVLATIGLPSDDAGLRRRVKTFILCNGYDRVFLAARYTAAQAAKEHIANPWAYTVQVYNGNLARLSCLYILTHWAESGLRSQVDLHFTRAVGATWYRFPRDYLPSRQAPIFASDPAQRGLRWEQDRYSPLGKHLANVRSPGEFLE